jgi:hypothetical protein
MCDLLQHNISARQRAELKSSPGALGSRQKSAIANEHDERVVNSKRCAAGPRNQSDGTQQPQTSCP